MTDASRSMPERTIGLDLSDKVSHYCELDAEGNVVSEGRIATSGGALKYHFDRKRPARIAIEAGGHSRWVSELLRSLGHEVLVANPRKLRLIYESDKKNDKVDAEYLARLARMDPSLLSPIEHRAQAAQEHLIVLRARDLLVRTRTEMMNSVRGQMKSLGVKLPTCSPDTFHIKVAEVAPSSLQPILCTIGDIAARIRQYDKMVDELATTEYPEAQALTQVNGVGNLTAMAFMLTLADPHRFKSSRMVGSYLGLCPRQAASGGRDPQLRITKAGDGYLRRLLVGSAHHILGPFGKDGVLRRFGLRMAERGGVNAKKRAVVAIARKLAVLLHRLWRTGEIYDPMRGLTEPAPTLCAQSV